MPKIIETKNLSVKSGQRYLLHNINWQIEKGEHWVIFGLNGSGKTTLLSIIAGFNGFTSGECRVFGEEHNEENIFTHRQKIGWVSSSFFDKYLSWESAFDIVLSGVSGTLSRDFSVGNIDIKRAKELLETLKLKDKMYQPFCLMSKGERQCVLIARALLSNPEILILDEPATGLDVYAREYILKTVENLAQNTDMTIIYVTHYIEEILSEFDKAMLLKGGRIYKAGSTEVLFTSAEISAFLAHQAEITRHGDKYAIDLTIDEIVPISMIKGGAVNE